MHPEYPWPGADGLHQQQFRDGFPGVRLAADLHGERADRGYARRADRHGPFEFRYINVAREGDTCTTSVPYREYPMRAMMDMLRPHYRKAVEKARAESTPEHRRGVGIAWGGYHVSKVPDRAEIDLELNETDRSRTTAHGHVGQGADTGSLIHVHEALRPLRLRPEAIRLVRNDTGCCPDTGSASGSVRTMSSAWLRWTRLPSCSPPCARKTGRIAHGGKCAMRAFRPDHRWRPYRRTGRTFDSDTGHGLRR